MAIIKCPNCGLNVSSESGECFACGYVFPQDSFNAQSQDLSGSAVRQPDQGGHEIRDIHSSQGTGPVYHTQSVYPTQDPASHSMPQNYGDSGHQTGQSSIAGNTRDKSRDKKKHSGTAVVFIILLVIVLITALTLLFLLIRKNGFGSGQGNDFDTSMVTFDRSHFIEETVLYDSGDIKITAVNITYQYYYAVISLLIENHSQSEYEVRSENMCSVNGMMIDTFEGIYCDVEAGTSVSEEIKFDYRSLLMSGINKIADVQFAMYLQPESDLFEYKFTDLLQVKTDLAGKYKYKNDNLKKAINSKALQYSYEYQVTYDRDDVVYNSNGVSIRSEMMVTDNDGEPTFLLVTKNDTDSIVEVTLNDIKVNGEIIDEGIGTGGYINPGCTALLDLDLDWELKQKNMNLSAGDIAEIGFSVDVRNREGILFAEPADVSISLKKD